MQQTSPHLWVVSRPFQMDCRSDIISCKLVSDSTYFWLRVSLARDSSSAWTLKPNISQNMKHCRTRSNSCKNSDEKWSLSLDFTVENIPSMPYMGVVLPFIRSLLFLFLAHFHENTNISVAIKSGSTVWESHSIKYPWLKPSFRMLLTLMIVRIRTYTTITNSASISFEEYITSNNQ